MITGKQRALRLAESMRKKERQQMLVSRRQWIKIPSVVYDLPQRLEGRQWNNFETLLGSLEKSDIACIDEAFREYLLEQWQRINRQDWRDESTVNTIRLLFRLRIADKRIASEIVSLAAAASRDSEGDQRAAETLLKLLAEVTINLNNTADSLNEDDDLWTGELWEQLNDFVSSLRICRQARIYPPFRHLLQENLVFYVILLLDRRVQLEEFVRVRNVGELYLLLNDCFDCFEGTNSYLLVRVMQLLCKALKITGNQEVSRCLQGIHMLLIDGIDAAQHFVDGLPCQRKQEGVFFYKFLKMAAKADVTKLLVATKLLAAVFDRFDRCIPAAFAAKLNHGVHDDPKEGMQKMHLREPCTLGEVVESLLQNGVTQVHMRAYWIISNVTGSAEYFRQYGLPLIRYIYLHDEALQKGKYQPLAKEIAICVLNYLCNITCQEEIEELVAIEAGKQAGEEGVKRAYNCLIFCLSIAADILEWTANAKCRIEQSLAIVHRAVFGIYMVIQHAGPFTAASLTFLQRESVGSHLEQLIKELNGQGELCLLLENVMTTLSNRNEPL